MKMFNWASIMCTVAMLENFYLVYRRVGELTDKPGRIVGLVACIAILAFALGGNFVGALKSTGLNR